MDWKAEKRCYSNELMAYALHEVICDEQSGRPIDYRFLEVNPRFEEFTGLSREEVLGKRVLDILPQTETYWIDIYGEVALQGKDIRFNNYSSNLKRFYEVHAYSPQYKQFACYFLDRTKEVEQYKKIAEVDRVIRHFSGEGEEDLKHLAHVCHNLFAADLTIHLKFSDRVQFENILGPDEQVKHFHQQLILTTHCKEPLRGAGCQFYEQTKRCFHGGGQFDQLRFERCGCGMNALLTGYQNIFILPISVDNLNVQRALIFLYKQKESFELFDWHLLQMVGTLISDHEKGRQRKHYLLEERNRYQQLFNFNGDQLVVLDAKKSEIVDCNSSFLRHWNLERDAVLWRNFFDLLRLERGERSMLTQFMRTVHGVYSNLKMVHPHTLQEYYFDVKSSPLEMAGQSCYLLSLRDNTFINQLQSEKSELLDFVNSEMKMNLVGQLAGQFAHEIKNPLAIIRGQMDCMKMKAADLSMQNEWTTHLQSMEKAIDRICTMINRINRSVPSDKEEWVVIDFAELLKVTLAELKRTRGSESMVELTNTPPRAFLWGIRADYVEMLIQFFKAMSEATVRSRSLKLTTLLRGAAADTENSNSTHPQTLEIAITGDILGDTSLNASALFGGHHLQCWSAQMMVKKYGGTFLFNEGEKMCQLLILLPLYY